MYPEPFCHSIIISSILTAFTVPKKQERKKNEIRLRKEVESACCSFPNVPRSDRIIKNI